MADANWMDIEVASLSDEAQIAYEDYKIAQRKAAELRKAFEDAVTSGLDIPAGRKMVFGYRFGKLSAALVADDSKPAKARQSGGSLADFLAAQQAGGFAS